MLFASAKSEGDFECRLTALNFFESREAKRGGDIAGRVSQRWFKQGG